MYNIEITYQTGNSFGSHTEVGLIGACWEDITKAAEALKEIKRHNKYFSDKENIRWVNDFKFNKEYDKISEYSIKLKDDNNNDIIVQAFWRGYFERLISAKIIIDDPDDKYSIKF
jgi:membrane-bound lytic murein transglycosylase